MPPCSAWCRIYRDSWRKVLESTDCLIIWNDNLAPQRGASSEHSWASGATGLLRLVKNDVDKLLGFLRDTSLSIPKALRENKMSSSRKTPANPIPRKSVFLPGLRWSLCSLYFPVFPHCMCASMSLVGFLGNRGWDSVHVAYWSCDLTKRKVGEAEEGRKWSCPQPDPVGLGCVSYITDLVAPCGKGGQQSESSVGRRGGQGLL